MDTTIDPPRHAEPLDHARPTTAPASTSLASTLVWTAAGALTLIVLGKAIAATGEALHLDRACWQLTGARAAASAGVVGALVALRRGQLAIFGALYGVWLLATHSTFGRGAPLAISAGVAGVAAWLVVRSLSRRDVGPTLKLLAATLTFNVLLTLGGLAGALGLLASRSTFGDYATGLGLRVLATLAIVGIIGLLVRRPSPAAPPTAPPSRAG